jgi:hypothetical protein
LNGQHWLSLQETYPVLPGELELKLSTATRSIKVLAAEGDVIEQKTRSVKVNYDCSPWEWLCLGSKAVYLFEEGGASPVAIGMTDVPLLYLEDQVWVSVEGSRDLKFKLSTQPHTELTIGKLRLIPKPIHRAGLITDLVRVEASNAPLEGQTMDLELDRPTEIPLIAASYSFAQYVSAQTPDGDRRKVKRTISVHAREVTELPFQVLVTDKKMAALKNAGLDGDGRERKRKISLFRPVLPLTME